LKDVYEHSEYFFCNKEEAQKILETDEGDLKTLLKKVHELGPKIVFITDGREGAYAYDSESDKAYHIPAYPDQTHTVDRTGAGDSFSSTVTIALTQGKSVEEALSWGPANSCSVIQYIGAREGLLDKKGLDKFMEKAPEEYKVREI